MLVRDPLACTGRDEERRGGEAEAEGIKMACPSREVSEGYGLLVAPVPPENGTQGGYNESLP